MNVYNFWDRGLLGLALDPFPTQPYVYVLYTYDHAGPGAGATLGDTGRSPIPAPTRLARLLTAAWSAGASRG